MQSITRFQVSPAHAQVEMRDNADVERPRWERGDEPVLYSPQYIVLAARDDLEGPVEIEVRIGRGVDEKPAGRLLYEGKLLTTGQGVLVGNSLSELHHIDLPLGWHPVRIYADQPTAPGRF